jgi:hypothetical protein
MADIMNHEKPNKQSYNPWLRPQIKMTASEFDSDSFARGNGPDRAVSIGT